MTETISPEELEDRVERLSLLLHEERMTGLDFRLHQSSDETGEYYTEATVFCDQNARVMDLINAAGDWSDTTLALFCTAVNLAPVLIAQRSSFANALTMTGCTSEENLIDMANVGRSTMDRMAEVVACEGQFKGWSPADDPAEIVTDLSNALDEATARAEKAEQQATPLWCVHLRGPDDLVPVASYDAAVKACDFWLAEDRKNAVDPMMPMLSAIPALWTFGAEEHAKALAALSPVTQEGNS